MPRISDKTGFRCTVPGCGGMCRTTSTTHTRSGQVTIRVKQCRLCGHRQTTREFVVMQETLTPVHPMDDDISP